MNVKIDFKAFKQASDVQEFLEAHLPIGTATPTDVFSFLGEEKLEHSELVDTSEAIGTMGEKPFEHTIFSSAPAKRVGWILKANWYVEFRFNNQKLAKIEVSKQAIAL